MAKTTTLYYIAMEHVEGELMGNWFNRWDIGADKWDIQNKMREDHPIFEKYHFNDFHSENVVMLADDSGFKLIDVDPHYIDKVAA